MWGWVKIASWHRIKSTVKAPDTYETFCGLTASGEARDSYLSYEKTCESCLRLSSVKIEDPADPQKIAVQPQPVEVQPPVPDEVPQPEPVEVVQPDEEEEPE